MRLRQVLGRMVKVTNPVHAVVGGPETEDVTLGMSSEATAVSKQYPKWFRLSRCGGLVSLSQLETVVEGLFRRNPEPEQKWS